MRSSRSPLLIALLLVLGTLMASPALGASKPAAPANVKADPTSNSVDVTWDASPGATVYGVCLMADSNTTRCSHYATSSTTDATLTGLTPTSGTDWYVQVRSANSAGSTDAPKVAFNLATASIPVAPRRVKITPTYNSASITWRSSPGATSYSVCLMADPNTARCSHWTRAYTTHATLTDLKPTSGTDWYVQVLARNDAGTNTSSKIAMNLPPDTRPAAGVKVSVMTMNLCGQDKCSNLDPWATRKTGAGALARSGYADIIATQESHDRDTQFGTELPGFSVAGYKSAKTLFYDTERFEVLDSGDITLNADRRKYAVWAEFRDFDSNTRFIVADAHLQHMKTKKYDDYRFAETKVLIQSIAAQNPEGLPVVYAGDYNSNKDNANQSKYPGGYDAPLQAFAAADIVDSIVTADRTYNTSWNSANQAKNPPIIHSDHVDHVYVDPEITVNEWRMVLRITRDGSGLEYRYTTPFVTDHNPVVARLTIPGE